MTSSLGALACFFCTLFAFCGTSPASAQEPATTAAKRIALTFDDAPRGRGPMFTGDERAQVLLEALNASDAGPAAFFITTQYINRGGNRTRIQAYADAGHVIANHSHTHQWLNRTDLDSYLADIDLGETLLEGLSNRRAWFRFPYLDEGRTLEKRDAMRTGLAERSLMNAYVTVDNYDWYLEQKWREALRAGQTVDLDALEQAYVDLLIGAVEHYDAMAIKVLGRSPAHVLLLHENDVSALFIDDLINALRARGWEIINPDEAYEDPIAAMTPSTLLTGQGRVAALYADYTGAQSLPKHRAIDEALIDQMLEDRNIFRDNRIYDDAASPDTQDAPRDFETRN